LLVDANQSWSRALLERLLPQLQALGVELIEQPVARGQDDSLDGLIPAVPLAADESCTDSRSLAALVGRYQYINVKLDKCGGLTEALALCSEATRRGLGLMVGNMCGSSLAMAPAFLIAQRCQYVDLDGPLLQRLDYSPPIRFEHGLMHPPSRALWG
jgi:L-Ala-D/L-Glu epimerase